jgi:phosphoserine phosphatase RsbU/P
MNPDDKRTILVVDDDITVRKLLNFHLSRNNYNVVDAADTQSGFDHLYSKKVDLVLCDVSMDGMDGFTFCRKVRENENFRALPFIFVTARSSLEDKSKAHDSGGDDLITKPFNIDELILKINVLIRRTDIYKVYGVKQKLENSFHQSTPRVLFVDDDVTLSRLIIYNLEKAGYECLSALDANEGFKLAKKNIPDIIISDIMMPDTDGFTFRKMLLEHNELKNIPFIFLTAKGNEEEILSGFEAGINDYVVKTAGPRVVVAKVDAILKSLGKERQKVVTELHSAADSLRVKVVPDSTPAIKGLEIKQWHQPFQGIPGGDFIDYYQLDDENTAVILGDVMGKKWKAWYFAFAYAGYVRSSLRGVLQNTDNWSPATILQNVNKSVYQDVKISEVFATLSVIIVNHKSGRLSYSGAGDLPLIYKNNSSGEIKTIHSDGLLLGFALDGRYKDHTLTLDQNDLILIVTDGITESRNKEGEQFGYKRLDELLKNLKEDEDITASIKSSLKKFTHGIYDDDVSLITIKKKPNSRFKDSKIQERMQILR